MFSWAILLCVRFHSRLVKRFGQTKHVRVWGFLVRFFARNLCCCTFPDHNSTKTVSPKWFYSSKFKRFLTLSRSVLQLKHQRKWNRKEWILPENSSTQNCAFLSRLKYCSDINQTSKPKLAHATQTAQGTTCNTTQAGRQLTKRRPAIMSTILPITMTKSSTFHGSPKKFCPQTYTPVVHHHNHLQSSSLLNSQYIVSVNVLARCWLAGKDHERSQRRAWLQES